MLSFSCMVSCGSWSELLDFSKFSSSAKEELGEDAKNPFNDDSDDLSTSKENLDKLPTQDNICSDDATEKETNDSSKDEDSDMNKNSFVMKATVDSIDEKITVNVYEAEYAEGIYLIIYSQNTALLSSDGNRISISDLKIGDKIEITYNGQVMMSYPPQVAATKIKKL